MEQIRFDAGEMSLIISCKHSAAPSILYWGKRLHADSDVKDIISITKRHSVAGGADMVIAPSLSMEVGLGYAAPSGFEAHRNGQDWGSHFLVYEATQSKDIAQIKCRDIQTQIEMVYNFKVDANSGLIEISSSATNCHESDALTINTMATALMPIPERIDEIIGFSGYWANEFQRERFAHSSGSYVRENRRGRTSHDSFPGLMLVAGDTREQSGEAYGFHLAWSGNHRLRVDRLIDGRLLASMGALLLPGEIHLAAGETFESPAMIAGYSANGLSALSRQYHDHVRGKLLRPEVCSRPRPVHYNSWEAIYFDHDLETLKSMADKAAAIGIERFVLDDGWFGSRRDAASGLGDWVVSHDIYPDGLTPLIDHVRGLGMEMGIWFEPEMVNPDSDLFRAHPDWILRLHGKKQVPFRDQYVLDISRPEVSQYLFAQIDAVLRDNDIGYIKWDMNRDLNHPGNELGYAKSHAHVKALYALINRMRKAHPKVEIESCASGGGRADFGILKHTDRIWTSDNNDAIDRQNIQRGASYFLPLNVLGAHVGPAKCHITGRSLSMNMRAATAMMGHMGVELNLLNENADELVILKDAIALYKQHRDLIHSGNHYRIDTPDYINAMGIVSKDKSAALFSIAFLMRFDASHPIMLQFAGLDAQSHYKVVPIWPNGFQSSTTQDQKEAEKFGMSGVYSGDILCNVGMQLPPSFPETVHLLHLEKMKK